MQRGRYFTMTGDAWEGLPTAPRRTARLAAPRAQRASALPRWMAARRVR